MPFETAITTRIKPIPCGTSPAEIDWHPGRSFQSSTSKPGHLVAPLRMAIPIRKLLLMFLVVCLQTQAVATVALSCAHSKPEAGAMSAEGCHQRSGSLTSMNDTDWSERIRLDCESCQLGCVCSGLAFFVPNALGIGAAPNSNPTSMSRKHFYSFVPESPQRPPISALA